MCENLIYSVVTTYGEDSVRGLSKGRWTRRFWLNGLEECCQGLLGGDVCGLRN